MNSITIPNIGERWHWKCEPTNPLVYLGKVGHWHQFAKVDTPKVIWCEVLTVDLRLLEKEC